MHINPSLIHSIGPYVRRAPYDEIEQQTTRLLLIDGTMNSGYVQRQYSWPWIG